MKRFFTVLSFFCIFFAALNTSAEDTTPPIGVITVHSPKPIAARTSNGARLWNLQDADILSVVNEVSLETGKNFVVDPRVSGKISLISSKPIKPDQVYDIFLSVLGLLGYSAVPSGNIVKIVPNMESSEYATRVADSKAPGKGDEVVVRVIPLENVAANQIIPVIRPMLPQWSNVASYAPGNVLILLGRAGNLTRIIDVIRHVDKASNSMIDVIPLHRASAAQVANVLTNLQNTGRAAGDVPQVSVAADERTNSVLLGGNQSARAHMKTLIAQLDTPATGGQGNTEVVYLKYLQAKTFAPILSKIAKNIQGKDSSSDTDTTSTTTSTAATASASTAKTLTKSETSASIQAEPTTNAIIITAPLSLMTALRSVISKLDIRPAQVLVEAVIVEINMDDLKNLGIMWGARTTDQDTGASTTGASPLVSFPPMGAGTFGVIPNTSIRAVLSALQTTNGANILSTPSIVVLDNHKAVLAVGQNIAEQNGAYSTTGSTATVTPFNTFDRKDVVLKLAVIPQINLANSVRMTISLSNDTLQNPLNPGLNPTINTSKIQNSVIINTDEVLVLGGLMSNTLLETVNKIPIVGDIPILGVLFRQSIKQYQKKNLIVFIKPIIMHNAEDTQNITLTKYNYARNLQINQPADINKNKDSRLDHILPLWKNNVTIPRPFES
jgi:general secretion pathway protein D